MQPQVPPDAVEFAGFLLVTAAAMVDSQRGGEPICPFVVVEDAAGRRVIPFESDSQEEAVAKGWASLAESRVRAEAWAFCREGTHKEAMGSAVDVLVVSVWLPGMAVPATVLQAFDRNSAQALSLKGKPRLLIHDSDEARSVENWNYDDLARGIESNPKAAKWAEWRP